MSEQAPHHTPRGMRREAEALAATFPALLADAEHLAAAVILGAHGRRRSGMGDEFWQYRPSTPTDSLRRIDWRKSGRTDQHFVRETEWQAAQSVVLWLDGGASMNYASAPDLPTKGVRARLLALALAGLLIRGGERVGLASLPDHPRTGEAQLVKLAEALSHIEADHDHQAPRTDALPNGAMAVFFSDFLGDMSPVAHAVAQAADRGIRGVLFQIVDPAEVSFPFAGRTIFESLTGVVRFETLKADGLRGAYVDRFETRRQELEALAQQCGWLHHTHLTQDTAQPALLWLYRGLEQRR